MDEVQTIARDRQFYPSNRAFGSFFLEDWASVREFGGAWMCCVGAASYSNRGTIEARVRTPDSFDGRGRGFCDVPRRVNGTGGEEHLLPRPTVSADVDTSPCLTRSGLLSGTSVIADGTDPEHRLNRGVVHEVESLADDRFEVPACGRHAPGSLTGYHDRGRPTRGRSLGLPPQRAASCFGFEPPPKRPLERPHPVRPHCFPSPPRRGPGLSTHPTRPIPRSITVSSIGST